MSCSLRLYIHLFHPIHLLHLPAPDFTLLYIHLPILALERRLNAPLRVVVYVFIFTSFTLFTFFTSLLQASPPPFHLRKLNTSTAYSMPYLQNPFTVPAIYSNIPSSSSVCIGSEITSLHRRSVTASLSMVLAMLLL